MKWNTENNIFLEVLYDVTDKTELKETWRETTEYLFNKQGNSWFRNKFHNLFGRKKITTHSRNLLMYLFLYVVYSTKLSVDQNIVSSKD